MAVKEPVPTVGVGETCFRRRSVGNRSGRDVAVLLAYCSGAVLTDGCR